MDVEAKHYLRLNDEIVQCKLCPLRCLLVPGKCGVCRARCNVDGTLVAKTYGLVTGMTTERLGAIPIRFHPEYSPDSRVLSIGTYGCPLHCVYCRNSHVSQSRTHTEPFTPADLVGRLENLRAHGVIGVCYTFNEPGVAIEYIMDCAEAVHAAGFINVLDTNAFMEPAIFKDFIQIMDILNIDLKGFDDDFYLDYCEGYFDTVWENIEVAGKSGKHLEINVVIVPGGNDHQETFRLAMRDLSIIAPRAAVHLVKMQPAHKMKEAKPPSAALMQDLRKTAELFFRKVSVLDRKEDEEIPDV